MKDMSIGERVCILGVGLLIGAAAMACLDGNIFAKGEVSGCNRLITPTPLNGIVECRTLHGKLVLVNIVSGETLRPL